MKIWRTLGLIPFLAIGAGCHVGDAPEPMAPGDVKEAVSKLTPQQQIDWINRSPMPPAEKAQKIAEIKAKAGITDGPTGQGAPGAPSVPGAGG